MSTSRPKKAKNTSLEKKKSGVLENVAGLVVGAISKEDEEAAAKHVEGVRKKYPNASVDELAELLIKQKCLQTGAVGVVTSGAAIIPGLGTVVALTFGIAADIGMTFKLQAELALEIMAIYQHELSLVEKRNIVLLVTGISAGANQLLRKAGTKIAQEATERLAEKAVLKVIPFLGVAASAGANILSTYVIGHRAQAYFKLGPEAMGDWDESLRAITGVDEREVVAWLIETTEGSWRLVSSKVQNVADVMSATGKSVGEIVVVGVGKVDEKVAYIGDAFVARTDTGNPIVRFWGRFIRGYVNFAWRNLKMIIAVFQGIMNLIIKAAVGLASVFLKIGSRKASRSKRTKKK